MPGNLGALLHQTFGLVLGTTWSVDENESFIVVNIILMLP